MTAGPLAALGLALALAWIAGACGGGGGGDAAVTSPPEGALVSKPGGAGLFFADPHRSGRSSRLGLLEVRWGRLVDVHDVDATGRVDPSPVFRDLVIGENVQSNGVDYRLETNPFTQSTRLIVLREQGAPRVGGDTFEDLVRRALDGLAPVIARDDRPFGATPSVVPRNACLVLRFDDLLADGAADERALVDDVRVLTGYPPDRPFEARLTFDPNHGGIADGRFHSTRVLVDLSISESDAVRQPTQSRVNVLGLPESDATQSAPNVALRLATALDATHGQFHVLRAAGGGQLTGPLLDASSPTLDIVRGLRSGSSVDVNNGFLVDLNAPEIVSSWDVVVERAVAAPDGEEGFDFVLDVRFTTPCGKTLERGDVVSIGTHFVEASEGSLTPDASGRVPDVRARILDAAPVAVPSALLGTGTFLTRFDPVAPVSPACWLRFTGADPALPGARIAPDARVTVRFSESMDPTSVTPFETFMIVRGPPSVPRIAAESIVVGSVAGSLELDSFAFTPVLPNSHTFGVEEVLHVRLGDCVDLGGNRLRATPAPIEFTLDPSAPTDKNASVVLRFSALDEVEPYDPREGVFDDLRGQVTFDLARGVIRPRPVTYASSPADRLAPVPSIMIPFPPGVQTPLSPLGSRLMTVWRYCDFGWAVTDETRYDLDVIGLAWAPIGGLVTRDYFEEFEIRLGHSFYLPDEALNVGLSPRHSTSGLLHGPALFDDNLLVDPASPQKTVHRRERGYSIDPADVFETATGTRMIPYPLNRDLAANEAPTTFTWRDTAILARGGPNGLGVPLEIETSDPLNVVSGAPGDLYSTNTVRSIGLPLLIEIRCFPSASAIGLNPVDISLAVNSAPTPNFRAFSTGGIDTTGNLVRVNPDFEPSPTGGFNPSSSPPGQRTTRSADNSFYVGQLDTVVRISRAYSVWIDSRFDAPSYRAPVVLPDPDGQPKNTRVVVEFRGASAFSSGVGTKAFDAVSIGPYGFVRDPSRKPTREYPTTWSPDPADETWRGSIVELEGARYFQMRFTFLNDIIGRTTPELSAIGVAYDEMASE